MNQLIAQRLKAVGAALISGVGAYVIAYLVQGQQFTLHGLESAVALAVVTGAGVHQLPNAAKPVQGHTVTHRRIPELKIEGKPLGRHVRHDSRSLNYLVKADGTVATARWDRVIPVLDQGQVGSCTGNAATGALGTSPDYTPLEARPSGVVLTEATALAIYSAAETLDGNGPYPPNDDGPSGLSVAKVCLTEKLISGYTHITSIAAAQTAIQTGPFIIGSDWYTGMDTPNADGIVTATGTVRGGHEYECIGYNATTDLWELVNSWGTSYGLAGHFFYSTATFKALLAAQGDATVLLPLTAPAPVPPPAPSDADEALATVALKWVMTNHTGANATMSKALKAWLATDPK